MSEASLNEMWNEIKNNEMKEIEGLIEDAKKYNFTQITYVFKDSKFKNGTLIGMIISMLHFKKYEIWNKLVAADESNNYDTKSNIYIIKW